MDHVHCAAEVGGRPGLRSAPMTSAGLVQRAMLAPWAIQPEQKGSLFADLQRVARGETHPGEGPDAVDVEGSLSAGVAVLPMRGVLLQHEHQATALGPVTYTSHWGRVFDRMVVDPNVRSIVIDIDSPGGIVYGVEELSQKIYDARSAKPILTVANSLSASAAYWIGTAAERMYVTPSGEVGSVGVYMMHVDQSELLRKMGLEVSFIHAGEHKVEGNWFEPLSDEARAELERSVEDVHDRFLADVARNRSVSVDQVRDTFGRGRTVRAGDAPALGMVDGVATLEEVVREAARLVGSGGARSTRRSSGPAELRSAPANVAATTDEDWPLQGLGVPYGRESADMGGWREIFEPGAFGSDFGDDVRVLWQHQPSNVLGRVSARTAKLWQDSTGIRYAAKPPDAQWARDAMESIRRGDVSHSSFAFRIEPGGVRWERRDGYDLRIVSKARMLEVGPQTFPAYPDTEVAVQEHRAFRMQMEDALELPSIELPRSTMSESELRAIEDELGIGEAVSVSELEAVERELGLAPGG